MPTIYHWNQPSVVTQRRYDRLITRYGWFDTSHTPPLDKEESDNDSQTADIIQLQADVDAAESDISALETQAFQLANRTAKSDTAYTILPADYLIELTAITAPRIFTLPTAASAGAKREYIIKDGSGDVDETNTLTIVVASAGTIDGASSAVLSTAYDSLRVYSNGSQWLTL